MTEDQTSNACAFHSTESEPFGAADLGSMLDCQKCILGLFLGTCHPMTLPCIGRIAAGSCADAASPFKHFYHFIPGRLYRPPISLLS